ncbi:hypothetical protein ACUXAV_000101 [Cupriavidus metallidurans]|jgi:hypothetical protein|nr:MULTISPECIES: hypothetical protein [Cupriavidus]EKZ96709.1 hypothetical protein D769_24008 [Cupriavidus sp. HMR-1]KWW37982.1 hypothetical protein AU374_01763 [Cupriavidus metallidurans]MDE4918073.1 hypothetical protein [Cupriavidus metallidurans]UBM09613.1 hypothetical protein LAI70_20140 [Cupriavidus metallidurans]
MIRFLSRMHEDKVFFTKVMDRFLTVLTLVSVGTMGGAMYELLKRSQ